MNGYTNEHTHTSAQVPDLHIRGSTQAAACGAAGIRTWAKTRRVTSSRFANAFYERLARLRKPSGV
eukprot:131609-Pyramimonas_sp.AAC.1